MSDREMIVTIEEEYKDNVTEVNVPGVGIVIDGKLRKLMDIIIEASPYYNNYEELVREAVYQGLLKIIN